MRKELDWFKGMSAFWLVLLVPWLLIAGLSGMAFDAGYTPAAYIFAWSVWSYPAVVALAMFLKRKNPALIMLPLVNFVAPFLLGFLLDLFGIKP